MFKKKLILASYPLVHLGLFAFTRFVGLCLVYQISETAFISSILLLGAFFTLITISFLSNDYYLTENLAPFSELVQKRCRYYFAYLDKGSVVLYISLVVSLILGVSVYLSISEILLYVALGFYLSSSAVILLFLSRK